jgi:hypothetical protein
LQNCRGLDLITAEKGGICMFLGEECCFYAKQSGLVRENACQFLERIQTRERNKETFWNIGQKSWAPWVAPLAGPLVLLMLLLLGPCVINSSPGSFERHYVAISETISKTAPR